MYETEVTDFQPKTLILDPSLLDDVDGQDTKIIKSRVSSLRLDSVLKAGLGVSKRFAPLFH